MRRLPEPWLRCGREHFYLLTKPVPGAERPLPTLSDHDSYFYIRDESQGLLVGCFEPWAKPIDPARLGEDFAFQLLPEDWDHFEPLMQSALHRLPVLQTAEVRMMLNGPESFTPDGLFLLGEAAESRGLFLGCGMNSIGVATGGGAGMALAHCIVHGHTPIDLTEADPKRFPDCVNSVEALTARVPEVLGRHYEIGYPGRQWSTARNLRQSPFGARWKNAKAQFGQVYGWERPLYFGSDGDPALTFGKPPWFDQVGREVAQAHHHAALFDQSTFGKIRVEGADAERFLNRVCERHDAGTWSGDLHRDAERPWGFRERSHCAAPVRRGVSTLRRNRCDQTRPRLASEPSGSEGAGEAVRRDGRLCRAGANGTSSEQHRARCWRRLDRCARLFSSCRGRDRRRSVRAVRLSYVGEAGWEMTCRAEDALRLYDALYEAGARPSGLYAQTSMRIEKRYLAMGHDLDADVTPLEAGVDFAINWSKPFIGRDALARRRDAGVAASRRSLSTTSAVPLGNEPIYLGDRIIGKTTSAAFGYRVGHPVALAYLETTDIGEIEGLRVEVDIARERFAGTASLKAAFDPSGGRLRTPCTRFSPSPATRSVITKTGRLPGAVRRRKSTMTR